MTQRAVKTIRLRLIKLSSFFSVAGLKKANSTEWNSLTNTQPLHIQSATKRCTSSPDPLEKSKRKGFAINSQMFFRFGEWEKTLLMVPRCWGLWSASESTDMAFHYFHLWWDRKGEINHTCFILFMACVIDFKGHVKHHKNLIWLTLPWNATLLCCHFFLVKAVNWMQNSLYKLFEHKCVLEVCVHIHPIMIKIHPVYFF